MKIDEIADKKRAGDWIGGSLSMRLGLRIRHGPYGFRSTALLLSAARNSPLKNQAPKDYSADKRMFEKSCQFQVHRMRYRLHPSCPEAEVSTYSTEFDGSQDFSNTLLGLKAPPDDFIYSDV